MFIMEELKIYISTFHFEEDFATQYAPSDWVGIIVTELKEMNLEYSEEYEMGLFTFGEEMGQNHYMDYARVVHKYMKYMGDKWPIINYLIMRYNN